MNQKLNRDYYIIYTKKYKKFINFLFYSIKK